MLIQISIFPNDSQCLSYIKYWQVLSLLLRFAGFEKVGNFPCLKVYQHWQMTNIKYTLSHKYNQIQICNSSTTWQLLRCSTRLCFKNAPMTSEEPFYVMPCLCLAKRGRCLTSSVTKVTFLSAIATSIGKSKWSQDQYIWIRPAKS